MMITFIYLNKLKLFFLNRKNKLKKILLALSNEFPKLGYIQGLNYLAGVILFKCKHTFESYNIFKTFLFKHKIADLYLNNF